MFNYFKRRREKKKAEFDAWAKQRSEMFRREDEVREMLERRMAAQRIECLCDQAWDGVKYTLPPMYFVDSEGKPHIVSSK